MIHVEILCPGAGSIRCVVMVSLMSLTYEVGLILESATWRANPDWGKKLGYDHRTLAEMNHRAIALLHDIRNEYETEKSRMVISFTGDTDGKLPTRQTLERTIQKKEFMS